MSSVREYFRQTVFLGFLLAVASPVYAQTQTLAEARRGFVTHLVVKETDGHPPADPPEGIFKLALYPSPVGELAAYVSVPPADGKKHPVILWLTGGFSNSIGALAWTPRPAENDQSASAFREAGILMMYPSLRGGNDNPGQMESLYGEVDDVLAAREWIAKQPGVDPSRIYLGGHSTGGTLALLVAEMGGSFRGVFAFGPVFGPRGYDLGHLFYDMSVAKETELRAPFRWLTGITRPTFVFEGAEEPANVNALKALEQKPHPGTVRFNLVAGMNHFTILQPMTRLIARKIVEDTGESTNIAFTPEEIAKAVQPK